MFGSISTSQVISSHLWMEPKTILPFLVLCLSVKIILSWCSLALLGQQTSHENILFLLCSQHNLSIFQIIWPAEAIFDVRKGALVRNTRHMVQLPRTNTRFHTGNLVSKSHLLLRRGQKHRFVLFRGTSVVCTKGRPPCSFVSLVTKLNTGQRLLFFSLFG